MYCGNCGSKIGEGLNFCEKCGERVEMPQSEPIENETMTNEEVMEKIAFVEAEKRKRTKKTIVAVVVIVVAIIAVMFWAFTPNVQNNVIEKAYISENAD